MSRPHKQYHELTEEDRENVDAYVEHELRKHCEANPDGVIKASELRKTLQQEACTKHRLKALRGMKEKKKGPFAPPKAPKVEEDELDIDWDVLEKTLGPNRTAYYRSMINKTKPDRGKS